MRKIRHNDNTCDVILPKSAMILLSILVIMYFHRIPSFSKFWQIDVMMTPQMTLF